jgi:hypothetical protein
MSKSVVKNLLPPILLIAKAAEIVFEVSVDPAFLKGLLCIGTDLVDELLHLPAVLTLVGGID